MKKVRGETEQCNGMQRDTLCIGTGQGWTMLWGCLFTYVALLDNTIKCIYFCRCLMHYVKVGSNCEAIDYCGLYTPCHPDATCRNNPFNADYGYDCICHTGWTGRTCYTDLIVGDKPASAALEIIIPVVILLVLIGMYLCLTVRYLCLIVRYLYLTVRYLCLTVKYIFMSDN
jgi:hypothetical protein